MQAVHVVSVATCAMPELTYLLVSADRVGVTPKLLGLGDKRLTFLHRDYSAKPDIVRAWLRGALAAGTVQYNDLVVCVDAFDVVIKRGVEAIVQGWTSAGSPSVLFSAEKGLYPRLDLRAHFDAANPTAPYRYINAGTYMGTAAGVLHLLDTPEMQSTGEDDQGMMQAAWVNYHDLYPWVLDVHRHVFYVPVRDTLADVLTVARTMPTPIFHFAGDKGRPMLQAAFLEWYPDSVQPNVDVRYWRNQAQLSGRVQGGTRVAGVAGVAGLADRLPEPEPAASSQQHAWIAVAVIVAAIIVSVCALTATCLLSHHRRQKF